MFVRTGFVLIAGLSGSAFLGTMDFPFEEFGRCEREKYDRNVKCESLTDTSFTDGTQLEIRQPWIYMSEGNSGYVLISADVRFALKSSSM